jgi:hypothetical protein
MKHPILLVFLLLLGIVSCKEGTKTPAATPQDVNTDSLASHLPVIEFLQNDIRQVDSFASGILKKTTAPRKKDSAYISPEAFHRLADQFLLSELDSNFFRKNFKETSLMDESSGLINFIYTATTPETSLRQVIVYIQPSSVEDDKIDRIYMETEMNRNDTIIEKKYNWKMGKYFYVLTMKQPRNGTPVTTMEKVIWDPRYFAE